MGGEATRAHRRGDAAYAKVASQKRLSVSARNATSCTVGGERRDRGFPSLVFLVRWLVGRFIWFLVSWMVGWLVLVLGWSIGVLMGFLVWFYWPI